MTAKEFGMRLSRLRMKKEVSARDMSLSIGQNSAYINHIESGSVWPSMEVFFYICEYLEITPQEFFETESQNPAKITSIIEDLKKLDDDKLDNIAALIKSIIQK